MQRHAAPKWMVRSAWLLALAWPLSVHGAVLLGAPEWGPRLTAIAAGLGALLWAAASRRASVLALASTLAATLGGLAFVAPQLLLFAPPVLINGALALVFGLSLGPEREPIISRFARMEQGALPPDLIGYTRLLTWLWTALFVAMGAIALVLARLGSVQVWSTFTNLVAYGLVAVFFVAEYLYRRWHYRQYRHATLIELIANVRTAGLLPRK